MVGKRAWRWAAVAVGLGLAGGAGASEPPSSKVARWHDQVCPRDLTPVVTGPCYGYYPTRWRVMPPCDEPADLVLPPAAVPLSQSARPATPKATAGKPAVMPTPYGAPLRPVRDQLPRGEWTARPASGQEIPSPPAAPTKTR